MMMMMMMMIMPKAPSTLATTVAEFSPNLATTIVAEFGDYSRQCRQGLTKTEKIVRANLFVAG